MNKARKPIAIVIRKKANKKRNDSFRDDIEIEGIHHHPTNLACDCCLGEMVEFSSSMVREEAKFIPATMNRLQHFEHVYECKTKRVKKMLFKKLKLNVVRGWDKTPSKSKAVQILRSVKFGLLRFLFQLRSRCSPLRRTLS